MNRNITFLLLSICLTILFCAQKVRAQVEIRDSVSISSMMDTTNGVGTQAAQNPATLKGFHKGSFGEVNSIRPGKRIDALISLPEGGGLTITIIGGAAAAQLDLILRSPVYEMLVADGNHHHGFTWDTTGVAAGTTFDFGLIWRWWGLVGTEYGCVVQQVNDSTYILGFEDRGVPPMFVDLILQVVVHTGPAITINIPSPKRVWPTLPASSGGNPGNRNVKYFTVNVTKGGQPAANYGVKVQASMVLPSGGHSHTNQPPLNEMGELEDYVNNVDGNGTITTTTDANGNISLAYTAPEFSGNVQITASSTTQNVKASDIISVEVPGLVNFRSMSFPQGGRPFTFAQSSVGQLNHPANDWCTPAIGDSLFAGIVDFNFWSASKKGGGVPIILSLNDMSLPWGGLFDAVNVDWHPPHSYHRVGLSVDVNHGGLLDYQVSKLSKIMGEHGGTRNGERPQIHCGFNGGK